jgi:hypothetical protein
VLCCVFTPALTIAYALFIVIVTARVGMRADVPLPVAAVSWSPPSPTAVVANHIARAGLGDEV